MLSRLSKNGCKNILFIDNTIKDVNILVDSVNSNTCPIIYSSTTTKTEILNIIKTKFTTINRIAFCFTLSESLTDTKIFLDNTPFFVNDEELTNPFNENINFLISIINEFNVRNIDWLVCNTLNYSNWTKFYDFLKQKTGVTIGASNKKIGNINYGGDWILESTGQDIEFVYFTESIKDYTYLFDDNATWADVEAFPLNMVIDNGYLYVTHIQEIAKITKIDLNDPTLQTKFNLINGAEDAIIPVGISIYDNYMYIADSAEVISRISLDNIPSSEPFTLNMTKFADLTYSPKHMIIYGDYMYIITDNNITRIDMKTNEIYENWCLLKDGIGLFIYNDYLYVTTLDAESGDFILSKVSLDSEPTIITIAKAFSRLNGLCIVDDNIYVICGHSYYKINLTKALEYLDVNEVAINIEDNTDSEISNLWKIADYMPMNMLLDQSNNNIYVTQLAEIGGKIGVLSLLAEPEPEPEQVPVEQIIAINQILNKLDVPSEVSQLFQNMRKTKENITQLVKALNRITSEFEV